MVQISHNLNATRIHMHMQRLQVLHVCVTNHVHMIPCAINHLFVYRPRHMFTVILHMRFNTAHICMLVCHAPLPPLCLFSK